MVMVKDIRPRSPVAALRRDFPETELERTFSADLVCALVGMSATFVRKVLGHASGTRSLADVLKLLDQDAFRETFVPRSRIPAYLLTLGSNEKTQRDERWPPAGSTVVDGHGLIAGSALNLIPNLPDDSIQCIVTSTPYWGTDFTRSTCLSVGRTVRSVP